MENIEALIFDVFGTVVDWRSSIIRALQQQGKAHGHLNDDWAAFAQEWRNGYMTNTRQIANGGEGPRNVDIMHRQILDGMLSSPRWEHLSPSWGEQDRHKLTHAWHELDGWPDTVQGLHKLKELKVIVTLSNGNFRLLLDMAKHAHLPWDGIFSTELFDTFKPNPRAYQEAARHLSLAPEKCCMVAAHIFDLRAAAKEGFKTIYIRRPDEDVVDPQEVKSKKDGGEVDLVTDSFLELADMLRNMGLRSRL